MSIKAKANIVITASAFLPLLFSFAMLKQLNPAKKIFESKCSKCHGTDGTKEKVGAKKLSLSKITDTAIVAMIETGKKAMPSFKNKFSPAELREITEYVKSLRK